MRAGIEFRCEPLPPIGELEREWRTLDAIAQPSFFVSWGWIGTLLDTLPEASRPCLLRGREGGTTVALALLGHTRARRRHGLVRSHALYLNETGDPQFDAMAIEHNGVLTIPARREAALDRVLVWFAELGRAADELHLSGLAQPLPTTAVSRCRLLHDEAAVPSYSVELDRLGCAGEIDPVLSANARQQLRRALRHFAAAGPLCLREAASEAEAQRWFGALKALHTASWERRRRVHSFSRPFFERFHRRLIERCFAEGRVQMLEVRAGERVVGYLYNFRHGDRVYAYQSGFDDADPRERPGYVAHAMAIGHARRQHMRIYDFMAGRNRLKETFATRVEPMLWQVVQQPRLRFRLEQLGRRLKEATSAVQNFRLPAS